jgi:hypothetical protein
MFLRVDELYIHFGSSSSSFRVTIGGGLLWVVAYSRWGGWLVLRTAREDPDLYCIAGIVDWTYITWKTKRHPPLGSPHSHSVVGKLGSSLLDGSRSEIPAGPRVCLWRSRGLPCRGYQPARGRLVPGPYRHAPAAFAAPVSLGKNNCATDRHTLYTEN